MKKIEISDDAYYFILGSAEYQVYLANAAQEEYLAHGGIKIEACEIAREQMLGYVEEMKAAMTPEEEFDRENRKMALQMGITEEGVIGKLREALESSQEVES